MERTQYTMKWWVRLINPGFIHPGRPTKQHSYISLALRKYSRFRGYWEA